jgi:hypothetical protein
MRLVACTRTCLVRLLHRRHGFLSGQQRRRSNRENAPVAVAGLMGLQLDGLPSLRRWRRLPSRRFVIVHPRRRGCVDIDAAAEDERREEQA